MSPVDRTDEAAPVQTGSRTPLALRAVPPRGSSRLRSGRAARGTPSALHAVPPRGSSRLRSGRAARGTPSALRAVPPRGSSRLRNGRAALITGASSGIGEALARCFAREGMDLVLVARSAGKLKTLARTFSQEFGVKATAIAADLSTPEAAARLATALRRRRISIDVLVNSAGVLELGGFVDMSARRVRPMIDLNVGALTAMLSTFVPGMVERGRGRILNVASIAGFQPVPSLAVYAATKAYVLSLTESLAEELRGSGVTATALCPGITSTPMLTAAVATNMQVAKLPAFVIGDVEVVAAEGYRACMRGDVVCVPGVLNTAATLAGRAAPKWLVRRVVGAIGRRGL